MNKAKEVYHKACRELEVAEYLKKEEAGQTSAQNQAKREKKVAKCHSEVSDAETAYRNAIAQTTSVQRAYYDEKLPKLLDSLQLVFLQRLSKMQECLKAYASEVSQVAAGMSPLALDSETVCNEFQPQGELEEYISKIESFFRMPADPVFEQFIRTPEGQVPASLSVQQKLASRFHLRKGDKNSTSDSSKESGGSGVAYAAPTGLLGMTPEEMMELQKSRYPSLKVPYVLVFLADCILKYGGPTADGIFRLSGSLVAMEKVKAHLNKYEYVAPKSVHDASALFKFVLRSFPEPLVPNNLYDEAISEPVTSFEVFNKLPELSRIVAGFVIRYLREYYMTPESVKATQMTTDNIATVFFPCFMKNPSNDLQEVMKHMDQEKTWVKKCLTSLDVSSYPSLSDCIAVSSSAEVDSNECVCADAPPAAKPSAEPAAAHVDESAAAHTAVPAEGNTKLDENSIASQRAKALPAKPQTPLPPPPSGKPPVPESAKNPTPASVGEESSNKVTEEEEEEPIIVDMSPDKETEESHNIEEKPAEPTEPVPDFPVATKEKPDEPTEPVPEIPGSDSKEKPAEPTEPVPEIPGTDSKEKPAEPTEPVPEIPDSVNKEKPDEPTEPVPELPDDQQSAAAAAAASGETISLDVYGMDE